MSPTAGIGRGYTFAYDIGCDDICASCRGIDEHSADIALSCRSLRLSHFGGRLSLRWLLINGKRTELAAHAFTLGRRTADYSARFDAAHESFHATTYFFVNCKAELPARQRRQFDIDIHRGWLIVRHSEYQLKNDATTGIQLQRDNITASGTPKKAMIGCRSNSHHRLRSFYWWHR